MKKLASLFGLLTACSFTAFSQLYQVPVYGLTSLQPAQGSDPTSNAIDGDISTIYHSEWGQNGIPDELNFYFTTQVSSIKKLIYTPRQSGSNGIWSNVSVYYSTQSAPTTFTLISGNLTWAVDNLDKEITFPTAIQEPYAVRFVVHAGSGNFSSCAEMKFYSETPPGDPEDGVDCTIPTASLGITGANDVEVAVVASGSTASQYQLGENIDASFDGDLNTLYHSPWGGGTTFPVVLNYRFNGTTPIDYLKYYPRSDGGDNGNFGLVTISYNTTGNSTYQNLTTFDFEQGGMPVAVHFPSQVTPLNIRISVADGYGGYASCAEMEFYTAGTPVGGANPYMNVFANNIYSALLPAITQAHIDTMSLPFYKGLAQCLFDETYVSRYRVQQYEVYPQLATVRNELKIGTYDNFENATGIVFEQNDKVALFARNIPSNATVYLSVKDFHTGFDGAVSHYALQNGLNVFEVTNTGLGYINYFNGDSTLNDVEINIVSGKINGYFDRAASSNSEWPDLLLGTAYPVIDVRGEYVHLVYEKEALRGGTPFDAQKLIGRYDTIVQHERMLMGLFKYDRSPKNRQLTFCEHGGGWYAGGLGVHLDLDWGPESITNPDQLGMWGIAHEYGHINQVRPDLKWIGTTEVTNNIHSTWVGYNMNNPPYNRLENESVEPGTGIPSIEGGRINGAIYNTLINEEPLQGSADYDVFKVLVPFWQLEIYYQLAGASRNAPILSFDYPDNYTGIDYAHWYGIVSEMARTATNSDDLSNGELLLNFVKNTCDAVEENLIPFFQHTGFLKPIDIEIDDYGVGQLTITQQQIDDVIAYVENQNYDDPVSPVIHYASVNSIDMFKNQISLEGVTGVGATLNGNYLTVDHSEWPGAVAYETYDDNNQLIYVSISGSGDPSNQSTEVYYPANALAVFAVGYDGEKILVYPTSILSVDENTFNSELTIYPNPVGENDPIQLSVENASGNYTATITTIDGKSVLAATGTIEAIEETINRNLVSFRSGAYILHMENTTGTHHRVKFIKK